MFVSVRQIEIARTLLLSTVYLYTVIHCTLLFLPLLPTKLFFSSSCAPFLPSSLPSFAPPIVQIGKLPRTVLTPLKLACLGHVSHSKVDAIKKRVRVCLAEPAASKTWFKFAPTHLVIWKKGPPLWKVQQPKRKSEEWNTMFKFLFLVSFLPCWVQKQEEAKVLCPSCFFLFFLNQKLLFFFLVPKHRYSRILV